MASSLVPSELPSWAQELCENLRNHQATLTRVEVVGMENQIALALAKALSNNTTVKEIDLDLSFVHSDGVAALGDMLGMNTCIETVRIETCFNDNIHYPFADSRQHEQTCSRAAVARGIAGSSSITRLILDGHGLDDDFWSCLAENRTLRHVEISRAQLPPSFSQNYLTSARHSLKRLSISNCIVYSGDESNFVTSGLLGHALDSAFNKALVQLSSVRVQSHYSGLLPHPRIARFINIGRFRNDVLFVERGFTADCAVALAQKLKTNTRLKRLYLPDNPLGSRGVEALADMLQDNTTLQMLDIRHVFIEDGERASRALCKALMKNKALVELRIAKNFGVGFANDIAHALQVNTSLKKMDLSSTSVGDEGALKLAEALETNQTLKVLKLHRCKIGSMGATAIAKAMCQNSSLKEIHLTDNPICEVGSHALLNTLKENYSLQLLTMNPPLKPAFQTELDYWLVLTPCGRAMLRSNVIPQLIPRVLHRISKDGGASSLFTVLSERPDLLKR